MRPLDLTVLAVFLVYIVWDGVRRGRGSKDTEGYLLAGRRMRWWAMGLSVMATQASAITLISTTGQGFASGMKFLHMYIALPFAMTILCATVVPWFHRSRVVTAYEWLERRFDAPTRRLASVLFLVSRSLAVGSVMYAPSVVLEGGLNIPKWQTILAMGVLATIYTAIGGNTAVIVTDAKQMLVMVAGIVACVAVAWHGLPRDVGLVDALRVAGAANRLDSFHVPNSAGEILSDKYNVVSGLVGGLFLFLGYFGADQEQVQRYLAGSTTEQSRKSLMVSAFAKVPMQFVILALGALIFVDYTFAPSPSFFRRPELERRIGELERESSVRAPARAEAASLRAKLDALDARAAAAAADRAAAARALLVHHDLEVAATEPVASLRSADAAVAKVRDDAMQLMRESGLARPDENNDSDYVFTRFLLNDVPVGIAGLVLAAIFAAAISSLTSPLNSLATSAVWDLWVPTRRSPPSEAQVVRATRLATLGWGGAATVAAFFMSGVPLVEKVNRIGSFFYGSLFGVFVLGRVVTRARGRVGWISLASGFTAVLALHFVYNVWGIDGGGFARLREVTHSSAGALPPRIEFLWYNPIGFVVVLVVGFVVARLQRTRSLDSRAR
jgi:Na+/proline symporter